MKLTTIIGTGGESARVQKAGESSPEDESPEGNVTLLGLVSLLNDMSSEIIQPVLPLFIASLGGGGLVVGLIGGLSDGLPTILKLFSGHWADRLGRRKSLVFAGYGLSALAKLLFPLSTVWQHVFVLRTVERCGKGIRSAPRDGIVADSAAPGKVGMGFGVLRAMDTFGAVLGSALAYLLWRGGLDFRSIFVVAGLVAFLALIPLLKVRDVVRNPSKGLDFGIATLSPELRKFVVVASLFSLANFSYMFFILRAGQFFSGTNAVAAPLLLYILFNLVYASLAVPSGVLSDRVGRRAVLAGGYALFALVSLGFALVSSVFMLVVLFLLYGLVFAMVDGTERAFVSDLSCVEWRCTSLGVYYGAVGGAALASGLVAGALWQGIGPEATFLFGAAVAALATTGMYKLVGQEETSTG